MRARAFPSTICAVGVISLAALGGCSSAGTGEADTSASQNALAASAHTSRIARLGTKIFFDTRLSEPQGQACASCHSPGAAFTDPDHSLPVSRGAMPTLTGNRSAPTAAYAQFSPPFAFSATDGTYRGGQFWDGRANSLEDQAKGPFLNPVEMGNPSKAAVIAKIANGPYQEEFEAVFGENAFADVDTAYDNMAHAIAEFERTPTFAPFTSKFDAYLAGTANLSSREARGLALFNDPKKGNCNACHLSASADGKTPPLFTDFTYVNLGLPKNPDNPWYTLPPQFNPDGVNFVDHGVAKTVGDAQYDGMFKVATLRNVAVTAPYMHNGYFSTLRDVVEFYNTRDLGTFPSPEIPATVDTTELGNLGLTDREVDDIVAFLETLTDGYSH